jgi:hypothetical protein
MKRKGMAQSPVPIPPIHPNTMGEDLLAMWKAYQRLRVSWSSLVNPVSEINCCFIDVLVVQLRLEPNTTTEYAQSFAAFTNYCKLMLESHTNILPNPVFLGGQCDNHMDTNGTCPLYKTMCSNVCVPSPGFRI